MTRLLAGLAVVLTWGCAAPCVPGETTACTCDDGRASARICRASGQFDPCACVAPPDAGADGGRVDAGPDPACLGNLAPSPRDLPPNRAHVPIGGVEVTPPSFVDPEGAPLTLTFQLFDAPGGAPLGPPEPFDGGPLRVVLPAPGDYGVEVHAWDGCTDTVWAGQLTGVGGRRLPFEVTAGLCCDDAQRPWVTATNPARLLRLELDGGWETLAFLSRKPTSLSLSPDAGVLAVAQDSLVSFFATGQPVPWVPSWTAPVDHLPSLVVLGDVMAWSFGDSSAQSINLDGGAAPLLEYRIASLRPEQGGLTRDRRFVVVNAQQQGLEALYFNGTQLLVQPFTTASTRSCGGLWSSRSRAQFFTGCGEVVEVSDGGFLHAGTLPSGHGNLVGLGEDDTGKLAAAFSPTMLNQTASVLWVDGRTLAATAISSRDLNGRALEVRLEPRFVFLDAEGAANLLTVLDEPSSTWWETLK